MIVAEIEKPEVFPNYNLSQRQPSDYPRGGSCFMTIMDEARSRRGPSIRRALLGARQTSAPYALIGYRKASAR